jgi:hypothetical protein
MRSAPLVAAVAAIVTRDMGTGRTEIVRLNGSSNKAIDRMLAQSSHLERANYAVGREEGGPLKGILDGFSAPRVSGGNDASGAIGADFAGRPIYRNGAIGATPFFHPPMPQQQQMQQQPMMMHPGYPPPQNYAPAPHPYAMPPNLTTNPYPQNTQNYYDVDAMMRKRAEVFAQSAAVNIPSKPTQSRHWEFAIGTGSTAALLATSQITIAGQPQVLFQLQRMTVDAVQATVTSNGYNQFSGLGVSDLKIGQRSQYAATGTGGAFIPLSRYAPQQVDGFLECDVCDVSQYIYIVVVNGTANNASVNFSMKGLALAS